MVTHQKKETGLSSGFLQIRGPVPLRQLQSEEPAAARRRTARNMRNGIGGNRVCVRADRTEIDPHSGRRIIAQVKSALQFEEGRSATTVDHRGARQPRQYQVRSDPLISDAANRRNGRAIGIGR